MLGAWLSNPSVGLTIGIYICIIIKENKIKMVRRGSTARKEGEK